MAVFNQSRFKSNKQEWKTPTDLYNKINNEFNFTFDLAADSTNAKCIKYFTFEDNALNQTWNGTCWLNPPYGRFDFKLEHWVKKAFYETEKDSCVVVMLIPARTNTKWWHNFCMKSAEIKFICGRPKFSDSKHGLPQPLALVVFKKHTGETKFSSFIV